MTFILKTTPKTGNILTFHFSIKYLVYSNGNLSKYWSGYQYCQKNVPNNAIDNKIPYMCVTNPLNWRKCYYNTCSLPFTVPPCTNRADIVYILDMHTCLPFHTIIAREM